MDNRPIALSPPGRLIGHVGRRLHCRLSGQIDSTKPTVVFETGLTMMTACWGWLREQLSTTANVLAYERAGIGWSDDRDGLRDAEVIARELRETLASLQLTQPVVLVGHSMGALFNRAFLRLYPSGVSGVIWLDPSHPEQRERSRTIRRKMRNFFFYLEAAHLLASKNMPKIDLPLLDQIKGLPPEDYAAAKFFLKYPRHLRTTAREARSWQASSNFTKSVRFDLPLLIISAQKHAMRGWTELQQDLTHCSPKCRHVTFTDASHVSLLTNREHATRAAAEISDFLQTIART